MHMIMGGEIKDGKEEWNKINCIINSPRGDVKAFQTLVMLIVND